MPVGTTGSSSTGRDHTVIWADIENLQKQIVDVRKHVQECDKRMVTRRALATGFGSVSAVLLLIAGAALNTWSDTSQNTKDVDRHEDLVQHIPTMQADIEHIKDDLRDLENKIDENQKELLEAIKDR